MVGTKTVCKSFGGIRRMDSGKEGKNSGKEEGRKD